jgi:hypothetical protein
MNKYKPQEDLEHRSQHLASFLFILGIDEDKFESIKIDDVINLIRNRYVYKHSDPAYNIAVQEYIKKQNIILNRGVRRAWFDVQVAAYEVQNVG